MNKKLKYTFIFYLLFLSIGERKICAAIQQKLDVWDRSSVDYRFPPTQEMKKYQEMSVYNFERFENSKSVWDTLQSWILSKFLDLGIERNVIVYILIGFAVLVLLFVIIKLLGVNIFGLFLFSSNNGITNLNFKQGNKDINNERLDKTLLTYIENRAYREAVRILYLISIRSLDTSSLIDWKPWKTDRDYFYELQVSNHHQMFKRLVLSYEYIWYGQFSLGKERFNQIHSDFKLFFQQINSSKNSLK